MISVLCINVKGLSLLHVVSYQISLGKRKLVDFFFFKVKGKLSRYIFMTLKKD